MRSRRSWQWQSLPPPTCHRSRRPKRRGIVRYVRGWSRCAKSSGPSNPHWWNSPVPAFGDPDAWLAIIGLAPGRKGANRTGRPFTGDYSGEIFYSTLLKFGLARGEYRAQPDDGVELVGSIVINAVKCLPPANRPLPEEVSNCRTFLHAALEVLPNVTVIVTLGQIAHASAAKALGLAPAEAKFSHGAEAIAPDGRLLVSSYHCSRQNTNTGRLTREMFESVFERALAYRSSTSRP